MTSFKLTKGADTFDFDMTGRVKKGDVNVGKWTTSNDNKIVLKFEAGGQDSLFDVVWEFNSDNHLCLSSGGTQVFDFNGVTGMRPFYATNNAVVKVRPDRNNVFGFDLRGEWSLEGHDLGFTITGVKSTLDGFIQDPKSRFMFHFFDKKNLMNESVFGFVGEWAFVNNDGVPMMNFKYKKEAGADGTFSLPKGLTVHRGNNQFLYKYDKKGHTYGIQFVGFLQVSDDFKITYAIDRQVSQSGEQQVAATSFTIGVNFIAKSKVTGEVEFVIKKTDGTAGTTSLGMKANFTASLGSAALQAGFSFSQVRGPNVITTSVSFTGSLKFANNGQVVWEITKNGAATTIMVAVNDITLGSARIDARLNVTRENGHVAGVYMLFGVSF